jgi:hypothetical protein
LFSFACFFVGLAVADMVNAFEGGNDLFVVGDDDDRGLEFLRQAVSTVMLSV